jgi:hypothetical protein
MARVVREILAQRPKETVFPEAAGAEPVLMPEAASPDRFSVRGRSASAGFGSA